jgi:cytochrome c biogenesis protein CcdA
MNLTAMLEGGGLVALPAALTGGILTGLNPCCLPMYPAAAGTCCAVRDTERRPLPAALAFAGGLAGATALIGVAAAAAGQTLAGLGGWLAYLVAAVPLLAGAQLLGWIRLPSLRLPATRWRTGGAFVTGLLLSLVIAPCGTPLLASILSYAAYRGSLAYGGLLLFVYGLGAAVPVFIVGATAAGAAGWLDRAGMRVWVDRATGALLLVMGLYLVWRA